MPLSPPAATFVDMVMASGAPPLHALTPVAAREVINAMLGRFGNLGFRCVLVGSGG